MKKKAKKPTKKQREARAKLTRKHTKMHQEALASK